MNNPDTIATLCDDIVAYANAIKDQYTKKEHLISAYSQRLIRLSRLLHKEVEKVNAEHRDA